jgi:hypothetical protein
MSRPDLQLPQLTARYGPALRAAVDYIFANFEPFAIVVSGSIVRGNPDSASDFDILVLHHRTWRRRVQKFFEGIPTEIFINSPQWMEAYFRQEAAEGRPIMAHMLISGFVMFSDSEKTEELVSAAQASMAAGTSFSAASLLRQRYSAACVFEDAFEVAARDPETAALILNRAIDSAVAFWFSSRQQFSVRSKEQLAIIQSQAPETAAILQAALLAPTLEQRIAAAHILAEDVLKHTGFFEWDSGPDHSIP